MWVDVRRLWQGDNMAKVGTGSPFSYAKTGQKKKRKFVTGKSRDRGMFLKGKECRRSGKRRFFFFPTWKKT